MEKVTAGKIRSSKSKIRINSQLSKISMLTAYDYSFAKIIDEAGVDIILVGDSLGNVVLGYEDTLSVTMDDMVRHTAAVTRGVKRALVVADIPVGAVSVANARRLIEAGAEAVKIEGVEEIKEIKEILAAGIPVMGHVGYLPQKVKEYGGVKRQSSPKIIEDAKELEQAGVFSLVIELTDHDLARQVTEAVSIPVIGCGAGASTDGQVLVSYDILGLYPNSPKFAKKYVDLSATIKQAVRSFIEEISPRSSDG